MLKRSPVALQRNLYAWVPSQMCSLRLECFLAEAVRVDIFGNGVGDSLERVAETFRAATQIAPCVV